MQSLRARVWLSLVTIVVVGLVVSNVHDLPQTAWPAPGALPSSHGETSVSVTTGEIATFHIRPAPAVIYGPSYDVDERTPRGWVNRFVGGLETENGVDKPVRPRDDMFWNAAASFGPRDIRIDTSRLRRGTYRIRKGFIGGAHPNLDRFQLAAVFTVG